jgi:hypothetical protein
MTAEGGRFQPERPIFSQRRFLWDHSAVPGLAAILFFGEEVAVRFWPLHRSIRIVVIQGVHPDAFFLKKGINETSSLRPIVIY